MRFLFLCLLSVSGCAGCHSSVQPTFIETVPAALASITGSGGVWVKDGPVLTDRATGAVSMFRANEHGDFTLTASYTPEQIVDHSYGATGLSAGDIDGDGAPEFFVTAEWGSPKLLRSANGQLIDITAASGIISKNGFRSSFASAFVDIDNDADLDLYIGQSASFAAIQHACVAKNIIPCTAIAAVGEHRNILFLNDGHGQFLEAVNAQGADNPGATLGLTFADLDQDGDLDLYLANDFGPDVLYRNDSGHFVDITHEAGINAGGGMGVAVGDINHDGLLDLYVTHYWKDTVLLNQGQMRFTDASLEMGALRYSEGTVGWGTILEDFNGDGWVDVAVARGWWDPDSLPPRGNDQVAYTIAFNQAGKNFQVVKEGARGIGTWGLVSNHRGTLLALSPFKGEHPLILQRP